jgi:YesN/AraC family two-component response regulator
MEPFTVIGEADSGVCGVEKFKELIRYVIMDIKMPD